MSDQCIRGETIGCQLGQMTIPCPDDNSGQCRNFETPNHSSEASRYLHVPNPPNETLSQKAIKGAKNVVFAAFASLFSSTGCAGNNGLGFCGNGIREKNEQCDRNDFGGLACNTFEASSEGELACTPDCRIDAAKCNFSEKKGRDPLDDGSCPDDQGCYGTSNILGDVNWIDAKLLTGDEARNAKASGKIVFSRDGEDGWRCSATIIASDLIITNHHCASDPEEAQSIRFYPTTESNVPQERQHLDSFSCGALLATDCTHDVSVLRCLPHPISGKLPGDIYGMADIDLSQDYNNDKQIYMLHTNCDWRDDDCNPVKLLSPGKVTRYGNECITFRNESGCSNCRSEAPHARHTADSLGGSSGGGMFDASTHYLIGINWGGITMPNNAGGYNLATSFFHLSQNNGTFNSILAPLTACTDRDGDGFGAHDSQRCRIRGTDCDDGNAGINPAAVEICDSRDNNCDGQTDNFTRPCGTDVGECQKGRQTCLRGVWLDNCEDETRPAAETCDSRDNNCDGRIDNGIVQACGSEVGECRQGEQSCFYGSFGECLGEVAPQPEFCDGRDNDCDGRTDNGVDPLIEAAPKCPDRGVCAGGGAVEACRGGTWSCDYPPEYVEEECPVVAPYCGFGSIDEPTCQDLLDNDCDGQYDENSQYNQCVAHPDFWKVANAEPCFVSTSGECGQHGGQYKCVQLADTCGVNIDCVGAQFPQPERCDGRDRNCNGIADDRNDYDGDGFGDCPGNMDCNETDRNINPRGAEVCDGKDNNCDGTIDEGNLCDDGSPATQDICNGAGRCSHDTFGWLDITSGTQLMWQINPHSGPGRNGVENSINTMSWQDAANYCGGLTLGGFSDWRLPTLMELRSLIRGCQQTQIGGSCPQTPTGSCGASNCAGCGSNLGPAPQGCYWDASLSGDCTSKRFSYWSSTPVRSLHWGVNFKMASVNCLNGFGDIGYTRCVR